MVRKNKLGTYEHFCLLIFAQGKWGKLDQDSIRKQIVEMRKKITDDSYHLYLKLTYREEVPNYSDCTLCPAVYELFQELKGGSDGIFYQGHHWMDSDDLVEMKALAKFLLSNELIKKVYILYLDSLHDLKKTAIQKISLIDLKDLLIFKKITILGFVEQLEHDKFNERVVYEIIKDSYF